jgi:hypothetical protein
MLFGIELQWAGLALAVVTFVTIWWGHMMVRIVHYYFGTKPAPLIFGIGLLLVLGSTQVASDLISTSLGIVGLTLLWDAFELHRQEARVRMGHAPLNPRVHHKAAAYRAANVAPGIGDPDDGSLCASCGSTGATRYMCKRGPECKVRKWDRYAAVTAPAGTHSLAGKD